VIITQDNFRLRFDAHQRQAFCIRSPSCFFTFPSLHPHKLYSKDRGARGNRHLHVCLQMIKEVILYTICMTEAKAKSTKFPTKKTTARVQPSSHHAFVLLYLLYSYQETIPAHFPPPSFKKHADDTYCFFSQTSQATCKMEEWVSSSFDEQSSLSRLVAALTTSFSSDAIPPAFLVVETDEEWAPLR
jgi:hypothetical protein